MSSKPAAEAVTQILYLEVPPEHRLEDAGSPAGRAWSRALDHVESGPGFARLYWGRRLEEPEKVQVHAARASLADCVAFLGSPAYLEGFLGCVGEILHLTSSSSSTTTTPDTTITTIPTPQVQIRHAHLENHALADPLGRSLLGRPIGTAIYKGTGAAWAEGAWPLWTHVVRHVDGCRGISAGPVLEPVGGLPGAYLVYVAWESVKHHDDYHHTKHFRNRFIILNIGHEGYVEYGHVVFRGYREAAAGKL